MHDVFYLATALAFFGLTWLLVRYVERLQGGAS